MSRQLTKAQILANYEAALVRVQQLEAELASLKAASRTVAQIVIPQAAKPAPAFPRAERRYTKADGRVFDVVADMVGGRIVKTHKFVGMAWEQQ